MQHTALRTLPVRARDLRPAPTVVIERLISDRNRVKTDVGGGPTRSCRLARYEIMAGLISIQGYSAWIQLTKSSRLTVSSRVG